MERTYYHEIAKLVITTFNAGEPIPIEDNAQEMLWMTDGEQIAYSMIPGKVDFLTKKS